MGCILNRCLRDGRKEGEESKKNLKDIDWLNFYLKFQWGVRVKVSERSIEISIENSIQLKVPLDYFEC